VVPSPEIDPYAFFPRKTLASALAANGTAEARMAAIADLIIVFIDFYPCNRLGQAPGSPTSKYSPTPSVEKEYSERARRVEQKMHGYIR
jgi:hypothetical protein